MNILLGVSGGIAAYKSAALVREFVKRGDDVRVIMTQSAQEFITPMTLQVLSGHPVGTTLFDPTYESEIGHIELARWPDVILIAPATANTLAKAASGMANDLLTTVLLATTAPIVFAPAMNTQMYMNKAVAHNLSILRERLGHHIVAPDSGALACKEIGAGRMPDPKVLLHAVDRVTEQPLWHNRSVLITAGPTREHMDPARFISNPSTGKMGYALARAAHQQGAQRVVLVSGPSALEPPAGVEFISITSAQHMYDAVWAHVHDVDCVIKAAAVADWRPVAPSVQKRTKSKMTENLKMERTQDILSSLGEAFGPGNTQPSGPIVVGFAAESHDVEARAQAKLERKNVHMLVANRIGGEESSFGVDSSSCSILFHACCERDPIKLSHAPKTELAEHIMRTAASIEHTP